MTQTEVQRAPATILVVTTDEEDRRVLACALSWAGYRVLAAGDSALALRLAELEHDPINLLITDPLMPEMGGIEMAQRMRTLCPGLRILYSSSYAGRLEVIFRWADPRSGSLALPQPMAQILATVHNMLETP